jgi:hypothetical protein
MSEESPQRERRPVAGEQDGNHVRRAVIAVLALFVGAAILLMVVDALLFP